MNVPLSQPSAPPDFRVLPKPAQLGRPNPVSGPPTRRRLQFIAVSIFVVAVLLTAVVWRLTSGSAATQYTTAVVSRGPVITGVTASGSVNPVTTVQVGTYVSGVIEDVKCDFNTRVRKGQLCAKIDPRPYQTVVDQDQANMDMARAQLAKDQTGLDYAKLTFDRTTDLRQQGIVSQDALDTAKSTFEQATAQIQLDKSTVAQHQAALDAAKVNLDYTNIVSPVDGTVVSRNVTIGQTVAASFQTPTLFLIATDLTKMQVDTNVSETDIGGIHVGNAATFTVEAFPNHVFNGQVTEVRQAPQTVQNVVTYDVVISVSNADLLLKPGMTATTHIILDRRDNVVRVPDQALRYVPGGIAHGPQSGSAASETHVWVLRNGRPAPVAVRLGLDDGTDAEIIDGDVNVGDRVVVAEETGGAGKASARATPRFRL